MTSQRFADSGDASGRGVDDQLLTIQEVAEVVRVPVATLRYWRHLGVGPHGFRVGRGVRYWRSDVLAWLREQSDNDPSAA